MNDSALCFSRLPSNNWDKLKLVEDISHGFYANVDYCYLFYTYVWKKKGANNNERLYVWCVLNASIANKKRSLSFGKNKAKMKYC